MSDPTPRKGPSLLEQAATRYDFNTHFRPLDDLPADKPVTTPIAPLASPTPEQRPIAAPRATPRPGAEVKIDRALLAERGVLVPGAPIGALVEEFRLVKRQLLTTARGVRVRSGDLSRTILVTSAQPDDGKTYCALNLAISMAAERDLEILLIDADFAKPDVMARLGLSEGRGLLDALADPQVELESCVVRTDIPHLSLLPCGTKSNADTELVASARTGELIAQLLAADPRRVLIFDSPPVLAASPAAALAHHAGQVMLVVRADRTSESDLREAIDLLDGCEDIQLLLNAVSFAPGGRRFGSYYGQQEDAS
ncbi:AAA family ATPase [Sphingomonas sp. UYEF23]|uniref:AAA family ATPase n=1 Tax=Sphingomonas sp. UYEF23 TaxID=1756408 RepID=UPI003399365B